MEEVVKTAVIAGIYFALDNTLIKTRLGDKLACEKVLQNAY